MTPGISTLPSGTLTVSNRTHSWAWRGFAASNWRVRLRLPHEVDDVLKRHVPMVRTGIVAPAQMHADVSGGNVHQRPVERFDIQLQALSKTGEVEVSELSV